MARIYKILLDNGSGMKEMFAIKPFLGRFEDFKDEIFIRMPELKNMSLKFYYEDNDGDKITIFNTNDFAIFQEQSINKVFVDVQKAVGSVNFRTAAQPNTSNSSTGLLKPVTSILKRLPSSGSADDIRRYLHVGVICDNCDKEIRGYRYKCLECSDFDLCMGCEPTNHSQHLLLRIANPTDAEICYRAKLGKRFGRHRRSESLCSKPSEDRHHDKKKHQKRHPTCSRPTNFADVVSDILKSVVGSGADAQTGEASGSIEIPQATTQNKQNDLNGKKPKNSTTIIAPSNTPSQELLFQTFPSQSSNKQLKTHIDTLSNMAQHFAAMMDPFATFINESTANIANGQILTAATKDLNNVAVLGEHIRNILNQLTLENVDSVFEQLKASNINTEEKANRVVNEIFQKAIDEPNLSPAYAQLCQKLSNSLDDGKILFKKVLLTKCQHEFEYSVVNEHSIRSKVLSMHKEFASTTDENRMKILPSLIEEEEKRLHCRSFSIVRFIGQIYLQDMLSSRIVAECVMTLLNIATNEKLEYACELLKVVGLKMETRTDTKYSDLTAQFQKLQQIASDEIQHNVSNRIRSMISELIELRKNGWTECIEPMDVINTADETEKPTEPQISKQSEVMIIDCTDDEDEENVAFLGKVSMENLSDESQSEKSNRADSPCRDWAFINANEIDDIDLGSGSAQASDSSQDGSSTAAKKTGTLPKKVSKPTQTVKLTENEPSLDYSELSRRLNNHIIEEKSAAIIEKNLAAARLEATRMGEHLRASKSQAETVESAVIDNASATVNDSGASAPTIDPRIARAVNTMTAMGFSNEGGWLNQLLEAVHGDVTTAIELMTPNK